MPSVNASGATMKGYSLVRDKHGRPKVDDPSTLPPQILMMLSDDDLEYLGLKEKTGNGTRTLDSNS